MIPLKDSPSIGVQINRERCLACLRGYGHFFNTLKRQKILQPGTLYTVTEQVCRCRFFQGLLRHSSHIYLSIFVYNGAQQWTNSRRQPELFGRDKGSSVTHPEQSQWRQQLSRTGVLVYVFRCGWTTLELLNFKHPWNSLIRCFKISFLSCFATHLFRLCLNLSPIQQTVWGPTGH